MAKPKIKKLNVAPIQIDGDPKALKNALIVFDQSIAASNKFYEIYQTFREGSKGTTSHDEQDLLRAMLVFACSGLDAVVKQLVNDALATVLEKDTGAQKQFETFVERRFKKGSLLEEKEKNNVSSSPTIDVTLLAKILAGKNPRALLVDLLKETLSGDSLQSKDQLLRVAAHFAITKDEVMDNDETTRKAFGARNEIIHEMDVNLSSPGTGVKKRRQRTNSQMVQYSENILNIARRFITTIEQKVK